MNFLYQKTVKNKNSETAPKVPFIKSQIYGPDVLVCCAFYDVSVRHHPSDLLSAFMILQIPPSASAMARD